MRLTIFKGAFLLLYLTLNTQAQYIIKDEIRIPCTEVKNQQATGTCWSFSTTSFLEAEIIRLKKISIDLSEMYGVRIVYVEKAQNYVLRQGKANFYEGGLAHDALRVLNNYGIVPNTAYPGLVAGDDSLKHYELAEALKGYLDAIVKFGYPGNHWLKAYEGILDVYMGSLPTTFSYRDQSYDPKSFADKMGINAGNYCTITSFSHHPFHTNFILEIPDNYSNGSYFNVKLDEMISIVDFALEKGYSVVWDGDESEIGFSQENGLAILPASTSKDSLFIKPAKEIVVNQGNRQEAFMSYNTTDDHLMHLVGRAKDQNGNTYYLIKNSKGEKGPYKGYLYMSKAYLKMKTIAITLSRDALPEEILKML